MLYLGLICVSTDLNYSDDPSVGLEDGQLAIPGYLLRREVFDPVVKQVRLPYPLRHKPN